MTCSLIVMENTHFVFTYLIFSSLFRFKTIMRDYASVKSFYQSAQVFPVLTPCPFGSVITLRMQHNYAPLYKTDITFAKSLKTYVFFLFSIQNKSFFVILTKFVYIKLHVSATCIRAIRRIELSARHHGPLQCIGFG